MANWILLASVLRVTLIRTSYSHPLPNTEVSARDSLPNLLASVLSTRNVGTMARNQVQHGQRQVIFSKTAPNTFIHPTAFQRNPESNFQIFQGASAGTNPNQVTHNSAITSIGQHGSSIRQGIFDKRIEDSRESFEEFKVLQRHVPINKTPTKSSDAISSKPVYFEQRTFNSVNSMTKKNIPQQSSPNEIPLFLVLRNYDHYNNNILSKNRKITSIQSSSDHKSSESDLSLFLPVIVDDDEEKKAKFRRLPIPSQFLPGLEHLNNHEPKELVDDLHGYVLDINDKDSHNLISFLKQSTLESVESIDSSSSSEEDYFQGFNHFSSRETDEDNSADNNEVSFEKNFSKTYFEEDNCGEKSSKEIKDIMMDPVTTRKNQGSFANSGTLFLGAPVIVPKYLHQSLTAPKRNKGQNTSKFSLRPENLYSAISSEEAAYEQSPGITKVFRLPPTAFKVPQPTTLKVSTQGSNYDPISSARGLSQTLSSLFIKRVPKITTFPSPSQSIKSTPGIGSGSIRLIPSSLYNNKGANHGISGVLGLGQPVSVGLLH